MATVKTAVSLPEEVLASLDMTARAAGKSRSAIVSAAIQEYLYRLESAEMVRSWNEAADAMTDDERREQSERLGLEFRRHSRLLDRLGYAWED